VELCAPCHSRRSALSDYTHAEADLLDSMLPSLLTEGLYFPDGQILEEVYVYGSFTQSKMYHRDVRCSDCHDVHSTKVLLEGNDLCLQCHKAAEYDTREHHFHKQAGEAGDPIRSADGEVIFEVGTGAQCIQCHMPGRHYMGIDYRPDHSLRIPRPDISAEIDTPDACVRCHVDKTSQWADEAITKWYGPGRRSHYGTVLAAGRSLEPEARASLIRLAGDALYPVIVRATALSMLAGYPGEATDQAVALALADDEALIRRTAAETLQTDTPEALADHLGPLLYDPVRAVRHEAARRLVGEATGYLDANQERVFKEVLEDYEASMNFSGDFAFGRYNLANLYLAQGKTGAAEENYLAALDIDGLLYPAKVNLAMLYNQAGRNDEAENLFREVVAENPELYEISYSLGLLLAEQEKYEEAAHYLERAAGGLPDRARVHYNLGLLLQYLDREEATAALKRALDIEPDNIDFMYTLADHFMKQGNVAGAREVVAQMIERHPDNQLGPSLMRLIDQASNAG
jgi:predicted CXXCH cytochrome family protein